MGPATEKIRLATFDCYGTLIDWEGGMGPFTRLARASRRLQGRRPERRASKGGRGRAVGFVTLP